MPRNSPTKGHKAPSKGHKAEAGNWKTESVSESILETAATTSVSDASYDSQAHYYGESLLLYQPSSLGESSGAPIYNMAAEPAASLTSPTTSGFASTLETEGYLASLSYPGSMTSSVAAHIYEDGGLRYHAYHDGKYAFPNDENEQHRDDLKHGVTLGVMGGRYFYAPIRRMLENGGEVMDLGTGTGIWAIELADAYPNTRFRGVDLSPIQPNLLPENMRFAVDDIEDEWVYPESTFDYIHMRHTLHAVRDRQALLQRIMRHLKPGGYVEFQEFQYQVRCDDGSLADETPNAFREFLRYQEAGLRAYSGSEANAAALVASELRLAGFQAVTSRTHRCPLGPWPRDRRLRAAGLHMRTALMDGLRGVAARPLGKGLGWLPLQIEMFLVDVRRALMDGKRHMHFPLHVVYARRPL